MSEDAETAALRRMLARARSADRLPGERDPQYPGQEVGQQNNLRMSPEQSAWEEQEHRRTRR